MGCSNLLVGICNVKVSHHEGYKGEQDGDCH
jgi:hypothetical protein